MSQPPIPGTCLSFWSNYSDLTRPIFPKWWFSKGNPLISGKSRLVKYYNLARILGFEGFEPSKLGGGNSNMFGKIGVFTLGSIWED